MICEPLTTRHWSRAARCAAPFTPEGRPVACAASQEHSGGEAASFFHDPLDIDHKEESLWAAIDPLMRLSWTAQIRLLWR
jgi:hypothetical protein